MEMEIIWKLETLVHDDKVILSRRFAKVGVFPSVPWQMNGQSAVGLLQYLCMTRFEPHAMSGRNDGCQCQIKCHFHKSIKMINQTIENAKRSIILRLDL